MSIENEYRLHYDELGSIIMCSMQNHPASDRYVVVDRIVYDSYFKYRIVKGKTPNKVCLIYNNGNTQTGTELTVYGLISSLEESQTKENIAAIRYYNGPLVCEQMLKVASTNYGLSKNDSSMSDILNLIGSQNAVNLLIGADGSIAGLINGSIPRASTSRYPFNFQGTPLPTDPNTSYTFSDIALKTAEDLWIKAGDRKIAVYWSGGIDSTVALVALMQTNSDWLNRIIIYTSEYSIKTEYPLFYDKYLRSADVMILSDLEFYDSKLFSADRLVVSGHLGDHIFGTSSTKAVIDITLSPYTKLFDHAIFKTVCGKDKSVTIDYLENQLSQFPIPIRTVADLLWFITFTHRWESAQFLLPEAVTDISKFDSLTCFFNTLDFQRWSMSNLDMKIGSTWNTYKQPAKDFIYEFTQDSHYRIHKLKSSSMILARTPKFDSSRKKSCHLFTTRGHVIYNENDYDIKRLLIECSI